jgi:hypothetical protein
MSVAAFLIFRNKKDYQSITFHDGCFYNKNIDPEYYFTKRQFNRVTVRESNAGLNKEENCDPNTTRTLNGDVEMTHANNGKEKADIVVLRENNLKQDQVDNDIIVNNNYLNKTVENSPVEKELAAQQQVDVDLKYKDITYHDYTKLPALYNHLDQRVFSKYVKDELIQNHSVLRIIMKRSLLEPYYVNIAKLILKVNLIFGANAFCFADNFIDNRANNPSRVKLNINLE